jgi:hypothetical protein
VSSPGLDAATTDFLASSSQIEQTSQLRAATRVDRGSGATEGLQSFDGSRWTEQGLSFEFVAEFVDERGNVQRDGRCRLADFPSTLVVPSFVPRNRSHAMTRNVPDWTGTLKTQHCAAPIDTA